MNDTIKIFLGAGSNKGFVSYFKQLQENSDSMQLLILKGGPGSGKSSLMKKVAEFAQKKGHTIISVPCASDPLSLDAVIDITWGFAIMDGTSPHTEDPLLPGAQHHIMYTGELWDCEKLRDSRQEIKFYNDLTGSCHKNAQAYIKAASALLEENLYQSREYVDHIAVKNFVQKIVRNFSEGDGFSIKKCLLSAVSVGEIKFFEETLPSLADKIYLIDDEWGGVGEALFETALGFAKINASEIICCPCSLMPEKTDHLIFVKERVALSVANRFLSCQSGRKIKADTFYKKGMNFALMQRRSNDAEKLLSKASVFVKTAKKAHDKLEKYYVDAMDFSKSSLLFEQIMNKFYKS